MFKQIWHSLDPSRLPKIVVFMLKTKLQVLHRTFNVYSAEYNTQVIRKALLLIMSRRITLDELQELRSLFEAYESEDLEGMVANEQTVFRYFFLITWENLIQVMYYMLCKVSMINI